MELRPVPLPGGGFLNLPHLTAEDIVSCPADCSISSPHHHTDFGDGGDWVGSCLADVPGRRCECFPGGV